MYLYVLTVIDAIDDSHLHLGIFTSLDKAENRLHDHDYVKSVLDYGNYTYAVVEKIVADKIEPEPIQRYWYNLNSDAFIFETRQPQDKYAEIYSIFEM